MADQICGNCSAQIDCRCQLRTATNGKQVCGNCIESYERFLTQMRTLGREPATATTNWLDTQLNR